MEDSAKVEWAGADGLGATTPWDVAQLRGGPAYVYRGHICLLVDPAAEIRGGATGFFYHRTRFLSRLDFRIDGRRPELANAERIGADRLLAYYLAPLPAARRSGRSDDERVRRAIEIRAVASLVEDGLVYEYHLANHGAATARLRLSWRPRADYADQAAAKAGRRPGFAPVAFSWAGGGELVLRCRHPALHHATRVRVEGPAPSSWHAGELRLTLELPSQQEASVRVAIEPLFDPAFAAELPDRSSSSRDLSRAALCRLSTRSELVTHAWRRAAHDLAALRLGDGEGDERLTPTAGAPRYIALFGRDSLMAGWQSLLLDPAILKGALGLVGRWTATAYDPTHDAQPGRVLHQRELGPSALLGKTPFLRYYGDHSASGLFLTGLASAFAWSGDLGLVRRFRDLALRTLAWMDRDGDLDGDGLYEYQTFAGRRGLKNQGWKDASDAILYPDGRIVPDPIALCDIQGLFYAAKRGMALVFRALGEDALAVDLEAQADALRQAFHERFWMQDESFVALGLDPDKRQIRTIASDPGGCLAYGILEPERAKEVAERLMSEEMFTGWGIRTLSRRHPSYNPLGYHIGSVWPFANALAARGFARYGMIGPLHKLAAATLQATQLFEDHRLPELFGGHARDEAHPLRASFLTPAARRRGRRAPSSSWSPPWPACGRRPRWAR